MVQQTSQRLPCGRPVGVGARDNIPLRISTRQPRYAKYEGGKKSKPREEEDPEKSRAAEVFREKWRAAAEDEEYLRLKEEHKRRNE